MSDVIREDPQEQNPVYYSPYEDGISHLAGTENVWQEMLAETTITSVEYGNLPPTVDPIFIERALYYQGSVIWFVVDGKLVCLKGFGTSMPNIYRLPLRRTVNAANGFTAELDNTNSVIMYNDVLRRRGVYRASRYAQRLAGLDNTIDINSQAQKTPIIIRTADKRSELSIKNAFAQYIGGSPVIAVTGKFDPNSIQVMNTQSPYHGKELRDLQHDIFSEYCTSIGIANSNNYKAERLISSEVESNNATVKINRYTRLLPRQQAIDIVNEMFKDFLPNGPITVKYREDAIDDMTVSNGGVIIPDKGGIEVE